MPEIRNRQNERPAIGVVLDNACSGSFFVDHQAFFQRFPVCASVPCDLCQLFIEESPDILPRLDRADLLELPVQIIADRILIAMKIVPAVCLKPEPDVSLREFLADILHIRQHGVLADIKQFAEVMDPDPFFGEPDIERHHDLALIHRHKVLDIRAVDDISQCVAD